MVVATVVEVVVIGAAVVVVVIAAPVHPPMSNIAVNNRAIRGQTDSLIPGTL
jgi:hypothetical protein